ncbi:MAG: AarF/ABC1/UbiB kinase family protein [Bacteriovoracaceae bacterium]|nr:AarF/ABC1/UbiB kinase family protein [Bacteriovoracaceae bacterium]
MKKIKSIKNGLFTRNIGLAKMAFGVGRDFISKRDTDFAQNILDTLETHSETITHELGLMKGSVMKAGQALSTYLGEYLPDNVKKLLSTLENQSYFLDWETLKKQIPNTYFDKLDFDPNPLAAASIGQVHLATDKSTKEVYAVKVQYPGIKRALNRDLFTIKLILNSMKVIPQKLDMSAIHEEIKEMLYQEMDYTQEFKNIKRFEELLENDPNFKVIEPIQEFSTTDILTTRFEKGHSLRSDEVAGLSQQQRNKLGECFLDLFFRELFEWGLVQTDAHFGNFLIQTDKEHPNWVLLDFGATKHLEGDFLKHYRNMIKAVVLQDRPLFFESFRQLGRIENEQSFDQELIWEYLEVMGSPFQFDSYDWGASDISDRAMSYLPKLLKNLPEGKAPKDTVFLDRKVASVFYVLKQLNCSFNAREIFSKYI